jgi:hypothetical protein
MPGYISDIDAYAGVFVNTIKFFKKSAQNGYSFYLCQDLNEERNRELMIDETKLIEYDTEYIGWNDTEKFINKNINSLVILKTSAQDATAVNITGLKVYTFLADKDLVRKLVLENEAEVYSTVKVASFETTEEEFVFNVECDSAQNESHWVKVCPGIYFNMARIKTFKMHYGPEGYTTFITNAGEFYVSFSLKARVDIWLAFYQMYANWRTK